MSLPDLPTLGPSREPARAAPSRLTLRRWAILVVAVIAVVAAAVWGVRGLLSTPIESLTADGVATLRGTWEPYSCDASACQGYLQAGARSVFVVLPAHCPAPLRQTELTVQARQDHALGKGSYRAITCAA